MNKVFVLADEVVRGVWEDFGDALDHFVKLYGKLEDWEISAAWAAIRSDGKVRLDSRFSIRAWSVR